MILESTFFEPGDNCCLNWNFHFAQHKFYCAVHASKMIQKLDLPQAKTLSAGH